MEFVGGNPLGDVSLQLPVEARNAAWASCVRALARAHSVSPPGGDHGVIVGHHVRQEAETWGHWIWYNLRNTAFHLRDEHGLDVQADRAVGIVERAIPLLNAHRPALLHNDPHAWNVLVNQTEAGWRCTSRTCRLGLRYVDTPLAS